MPPDRTFPRTPNSDTSHLSPRMPAIELGSFAHPSAPAPHEGPHIRPIVRTAILILIIVFGALYFWGAYLNSKDVKGSRPAASAANS